MSVHGCPESGADVTRLIPTTAREYSFRRYRVRVIGGPDVGKSRTSEGPDLSIGTDRGNHLVLTDGTVSRHHCTLSAYSRGVKLRDLGSTNGTRLAGHRIEAGYLKHGSTIELGVTKLAYEISDEVVCEALSLDETWGRVHGRSSAMRRIFALVARIAPCETTVLIEGETGTGKGLMAEAIHAASPRAGRPFMVVDCGSIAPSLVESELFGHERGSFTGAHSSRAGAFEAAAHGTILLDEIGELPLDMQPKLLRALEERTVKRVGGTEPVRLDVRVIAATNRDLRAEVNRGAFRADLFFRLNIVNVRIPPLRERRDDIPLLVTHFYEQFNATEGATPPPELLDAFARRDWPGNVRELRNAVERATVLGHESDLKPSMIPAPSSADDPQGGWSAETAAQFDPALSFRAAKEHAVTVWERSYLRELLARSGGNISAAARAARTDRNHLRELIRRHGLVPGDD